MIEYIATNTLTLEQYSCLAANANEAYIILKDKLYIGYDWIIQSRRG